MSFWKELERIAKVTTLSNSNTTNPTLNLFWVEGAIRNLSDRVIILEAQVAGEPIPPHLAKAFGIAQPGETS